ncbi:MAG: ABC transporter permease [Clostridia bacterium]|nr:ABC transporter permease [Clostridia bacterium]
MKKTRIKINGNLVVLLIALIVVVAGFSFLNHNFFTAVNMVNILIAASLVGLVAIGHTYLIIEGQNDLSPGSLVAFLGVLSALLVSKGLPFPVTLLITLLVGAIVGLCNAFMVNRLHLEAFIATLVTQSIMRGFAYIICDGKSVGITNKTFIWIGKARILGLPFSVWLMLIAFIIGGVVLARTRFGRSVYAIGGNAQAARLAGMDPHRIVTISFVTMGLLCSLGGIVYVARLQSGQPAANVNLEFDAITAVILGGVSFSGGVGNMLGTVIGVFLIQSFNTGLNMVGIQNANFWQYVGKGALLLIALTADYIRKVNNDKRLLAESKKNR